MQLPLPAFITRRSGFTGDDRDSARCGAGGECKRHELRASGKVCDRVQRPCALAGAARSEEIKVTLLQLNDVYEITPLDRESVGKLARVAALRNELRAKNPNTFTLIAGDFVSPSAIGNALYEGESLKGRQMVSVLNAVGLDYATFGNHEFDIPRDLLLRRIRESTFRWTSANVTDALGDPFEGVPRTSCSTYPVRAGVRSGSPSSA